MENWIESLMNYPGVVFLMALENIFPPIPSELVMPLAGFQATRDKMHIVGAILCGILGAMIGQVALYYIGKGIGEERLTQWADKHGEWLTLSGDEIRKGKEWFEKHGHKAAFWGRMVPGLRSLVSIPAGITGMALPKFLLYSTLGTTIWVTSLGLLGFFLGERYEGVERYVGIASNVIIGGMVAYFVYQVWKRKQEKAGKTNGDNAAPEQPRKTQPSATP